MTGIVGGFLTGGDLQSHADSLYQEEWYQTRQVEKDNAGIALVEHSDRDAASNRLWEGSRGIGVVHGVVSRLGPFADIDEMFAALFDRPADTLSSLEGPFVLAGIDTTRDRVVIATDSAGARPCYYTDNGAFVFSSELKALIQSRPDPAVDTAAVSDMLSMGCVIGTNTLLETVSNLPPATILEYTGSERRVQQYWQPTFDKYPGTEYPDCWLSNFSTAIADVVETVEETLTLWLSGGLDSRASAAVLGRSNADFDTLTYKNEANQNPQIAATVAARLGVKNALFERGSPEQFTTGIEKSVRVTDGMIAWTPFVNLSSLFEQLHDRANVVMEGGTFMGEDMWLHALRNSSSPVETIYHKWQNLPRAEVQELLTEEIEPLQSLRADIDGCDLTSPREQKLYGMRRLYAYSHMRSNIVQRSQVGTRVVSDSRVLDTALEIPDEYRMQTIPFTGGQIPAGVPKLKLAVLHRFNAGLDEIPYARTGLAPTVPYPGHVIGFGVQKMLTRVRDAVADHQLDWYRRNRHVRAFLDDALDSVSRRWFLDEAAVMNLRRRTLDGDITDIRPIASLTALELWLQAYLD